MKRSTSSALALTVAGALLLSSCGVGGADGDGSTTTSPDTIKGEITGEISFQTWNLKANFQDFLTA